MSRNVFKALEIQVSPTRVHISPPVFGKLGKPLVSEPLELAEEVEAPKPVYHGPSPEELAEERRRFHEGLEQERESILEIARQEAQRIVQEAEQAAFDEVQRKGAQAQEAKAKAEQDAARIVEEAKASAEKTLEEGRKELADLQKQAQAAGQEEGRLQGWQEGKTEADRLIDRLHLVLAKAIERRNEILVDSEAQLVSLVLSIARKVVKVLSDNQRNVVVNNVIQALRKLRSKTDVVIRVNLIDLKITSEHMKEITERLERVGNVSVMEDASVDPGGCIIETDFGEIDARISSQLQEIEDKILEVTPIRTHQRENSSNS